MTAYPKHNMLFSVQGYLAYKNPPPRRTLQEDHAQAPVAVLGGGSVPDEQVSPVARPCLALQVLVLAFGPCFYLADVNLIGPDFQSKNFLAMKVTTQHDLQE